HGNTTMVVNASLLAVNTTWYVLLDAPNYLLAFNLSRGGQYLDFPYEANVTDILDLNFQVPETGGNSSYWIEYFTLPINSSINFNSLVLSFTETWDINKTVSQITNVNGTYDLQAFWKSSDKTKVGTLTRKLDVFINTTLTINSTDTIEVLIGEKITIWANYTSNHNSTLSDLSHINYAKIWCNASWPDGTRQNTTMNQPTGTYYNSSFTSDMETPGTSGTITISTQLSWFVNWTRTVTVLFVQNTTFSVDVKDLTLQWRENATIKFDYNETGGNRIPVATVTIVDTNEIFTYSTGKDLFQLNSTSFPGVDTYANVIIRANSSGYLTREWYFNLTIAPGRTNITGKIGSNQVLNDSTIITKKFSNSSYDTVTLNLHYYHNLTGDPLDIDMPILDSSIPVTNIQKESNLSWSITLNPNETGVFLINFTFFLNNYRSSIFVFHLSVVKAGTIIEHIPLENIQVYYTEYYDFFLLYKNTEYNENVTGLIKDSGITINNSMVVDVNQTDEGYWFRFNPSPSMLSLGRYSINITFSHIYLNPSSIEVTFIVVNMPTKPLNITNFRYNQSIFVEDVLYIGGEGYQTIRGQNISSLDTLVLRMNGTLVMKSLYNYQASENWFDINFTTTSFHYGNYSLTLEIGKVGFQNQTINFNITLLGRQIILEVTLPGKKFEQGDPIEITAILTYVQEIAGGFGAGLSLAPLEAVNVSFYVVLKYENDTNRVFEITNQTNDLGQTSFTIDGKYTLGAVKFTNITVWSGPSLSGLPSSYSMSREELEGYQIIKIIDPLEIIVSVIIIGSILLLSVGTLTASSIFLNRKRKQRSQLIRRKRLKIEQSFEDIKSIRLLIARHESGLQFYSEKTIAELKTDTDALSGMSAALSTFMEEVSDGMRSRTEEEKEKEKIEVMSREGLHMLIWHGSRSSFIIISETRLPDYFKERLAKLGREVESKYTHDLEDFYRSDQIPTNQIKKMIRKHIPLHYFSAFILNEGVLTLENIKLSKKEKKMLKLIKEILFQKEGVQFFFSEQIISHLSKYYNRSEAIKFLDRSIEINLLIEASQEDILSITE
ncbi:MAG: hypothetical protein JSW11_09760, partial [Candidatus Heimdallarchaeota archaeon]